MPNLYNNVLKHVVIAGSDPSAPTLGKGIDFQLTYEHNATCDGEYQSGLSVRKSAR